MTRSVVEKNKGLMVLNLQFGVEFLKIFQKYIHVIHALEFALQMIRRGNCLLKSRGICNLPITSGLNFSPVTEQKRVMVSISLASLPVLHFSPCSTKLWFGTPF
jgi:hypothetical protein